MGGRPDGQQVMVNQGYAYVGHMFSQGFSVIDVRDPRAPRAVGYVPCPDGTWSLHLQSADGLLLVANAQDLGRVKTLEDDRQYYSGSMSERLAGESGRGYAAGVRIYDTTDPAVPREIGFAPIDGVGVHRVWYDRRPLGCTCRRCPTAWSDFIFMALDVGDPTKPTVRGPLSASRHAHGGRRDADVGRARVLVPSRHRLGRHGLRDLAGRRRHAVDVTDRSSRQLISHRNWCPPFGAGPTTHFRFPTAI